MYPVNRPVSGSRMHKIMAICQELISYPIYCKNENYNSFFFFFSYKLYITCDFQTQPSLWFKHNHIIKHPRMNTFSMYGSLCRDNPENEWTHSGQSENMRNVRCLNSDSSVWVKISEVIGQYPNRKPRLNLSLSKLQTMLHGC